MSSRWTQLAFHGFMVYLTVKIKQSFKVRSEDEYFTLHFIVTGADPQAFIELLDTQDKVVDEDWWMMEGQISIT